MFFIYLYRTHTLQSSHTSRSLPAMVTGVTGDINSPYMKQFVHSKSQQYRRLKTEWRTNVFLGRSRIQVCKYVYFNFVRQEDISFTRRTKIVKQISCKA